MTPHQSAAWDAAQPDPRPKDPAAVALGRRGGKAGTGKAKARSSAQATAAVNARWANRKKKTAKP